MWDERQALLDAKTKIVAYYEIIQMLQGEIEKLEAHAQSLKETIG